MFSSKDMAKANDSKVDNFTHSKNQYDYSSSKEFIPQSPTLRPIAFAAIVFSTVAITSCLIAFPLIIHYIQTLESNVRLDLDFCKSNARDMWKEMFELRMNGRHAEALRLANMVMSRRRLEKRDTIADFWRRRLLDMQLRDDPVESYSGRSSIGSGYNGGDSEVSSTRNNYHKETNEGYRASKKSSAKSFGITRGSETYGTHEDQFVETPSMGCCTCQRGPPGLPGPRGRDGLDGLRGEPGLLGPPGPPAPQSFDALSLFPPQCLCEAPRGEPGPKGQQGADGVVGPPGQSGEDGKPGDQGSRGPIGLPGQPGQSGRPGPLGEPGVYRDEIGPPGRPGAPGRQGSPGPPGAPGAPGNDGLPGRPGAAGPPGPPGASGKSGALGANGRPGEQGAPGSCGHCPQVRLAPGY